MNRNYSPFFCKPGIPISNHINGSDTLLQISNVIFRCNHKVILLFMMDEKEKYYNFKDMNLYYPLFNKLDINEKILISSLNSIKNE